LRVGKVIAKKVVCSFLAHPVGIPQYPRSMYNFIYSTYTNSSKTLTRKKDKKEFHLVDD